MAGIKDLKQLLVSIEPVLAKEEYIFCSFQNISVEEIVSLNPVCTFHEKEGITLIITTQKAISNNIDFESVYKLISLNIHSSLDAVGLTAAISTKLASKNISANIVAAYYHDHIFVQKEKSEEAMNTILELQKESQ